MSVNHQFADQIIHQKIHKWIAQKNSHNQAMLTVNGNLLKSANEIKTIIQECSPDRVKKSKIFSTPTPFSLTERKAPRDANLLKTPDNLTKSPDY